MDEKPVQIIKNKGRHKTETRVFNRNIHEHFCMQKGCKFYGRHAQQGVCHTTKTWAGSEDWSYIDAIMEEAAKATKEQLDIARKYKGKTYVRYLEDQLVCMWMNQMTGMDELIRLRRKVALLEHKSQRLRLVRRPEMLKKRR